MAYADADMDIQEDYDDIGEVMPPIQYNQATEIIPDKQRPLLKLRRKQPAVVGSMQMLSGLVSVGVGILFAATQEMQESLFTLFRVSHLTGVIFIVAGVVSILLFKYPELLTFSLSVNYGCIIAAAIAACLISVDLANWNPAIDLQLKMEVMELYVLLLGVVPSAIICFWLFEEKLSNRRDQLKTTGFNLQASMQVGSGLVSVGMGILFATTYGMDWSLFTLFRVSYVTGVLFIVSGVLSNLLFKYPELLPFSLSVNCGCIIVAASAACLISVDLANWNPAIDLQLKMEVLVLCLLLLEVVLTAILCFWLFKEKHAKSP